MKAQLIIALDVPSAREAEAVVRQLPAEIDFYKVGLELFCAEGPAVLQMLQAHHKNIFLDLKLHDIPRTVERAVRAAGQHGVSLLTVHASGGRAMLGAAMEASRSMGPGAPRVVAVTALTSLDQADLRDLGVGRTPAEQVLALAELALAAGVDGLVSSVQEAAALRKRFGPQPLLVTPGIRLPGNEVADQKRVGTPAFAVQAGASHLVVGRPVLEAADPAAAARQLLAEIQKAGG